MANFIFILIGVISVPILAAILYSFVKFLTDPKSDQKLEKISTFAVVSFPVMAGFTFVFLVVLITINKG